MSSFTPRTTVPANDDPYYTMISYGGLNPCIAGDPAAWTGSVLANCVGYCYGRWYEILGYDPNLYTGDAKYWWGHNSQYTHGSEPRLGAIICFTSSAALPQNEHLIEGLSLLYFGIIILSTNKANPYYLWFTITSSINP